MPALNYYERLILRYLYSHGKWSNTNHIAERTGIAWITAEKHLENLFRRGYVSKGRSGSVTYWRAR